MCFYSGFSCIEEDFRKVTPDFLKDLFGIFSEERVLLEEELASGMAKPPDISIRYWQLFGGKRIEASV